MNRIAGVVFAALLIGGAAGAQVESKHDGNELLQKCGALEKLADGDATADLKDVAWCDGFVGGVIRTSQVMNFLKGRDCSPKQGVTTGQMVRIVLKYLRDHPEELHQSDAFLFLAAFDEVVSCEEVD